jgi:hypothetical protein
MKWGTKRGLFYEGLEAAPWNEPADLVALTEEIFTVWQVYQIATRFWKRGTTGFETATTSRTLACRTGLYTDMGVV